MLRWIRGVIWVLLAAWGILNLWSICADIATFREERARLIAYGAGYREGIHWAAYGRGRKEAS